MNITSIGPLEIRIQTDFRDIKFQKQVTFADGEIDFVGIEYYARKLSGYISLGLSGGNN